MYKKIFDILYVLTTWNKIRICDNIITKRNRLIKGKKGIWQNFTGDPSYVYLENGKYIVIEATNEELLEKTIV